MFRTFCLLVVIFNNIKSFFKCGTTLLALLDVLTAICMHFVPGENREYLSHIGK